MFKQVYKIDTKGFIIETLVMEFKGDGSPVDALGADIIVSENPHGFYKAKWDGLRWIEGATQEEIDEITTVEPQPPTEMEMLAQSVSQREIMGIIQGQQISDLEIRLLVGGL